MIAVGMHVEIQRSDGRIHGAVIAEVRRNGRYMVEWHEKGETKGKESTLEELLKLNPTLHGTKPTPVVKPLETTQHRNLYPKNTNISNMGVSDEEETFLLNGFLKKPNPALKEKRRTVYMPEEKKEEFVRPAPVAIQKVHPTPPAEPEYQQQHPQPVRKFVVPPAPLSLPQKPKAAPSPIAPAPLPEKIVAQKIERRTPSPTTRQQGYPQQVVSPTNQHFVFAEMIRNFRSNIDYRPLSIFDDVSESRISVCVRKRPLNKKETTKNEVDVITIPSRDIVVLHQPQTRVDLTKYLENQKFRFDYTFDESATNEVVYKFTAQPLVKTIFENGTATCFAYGQTGSGKTHTMGGDFSGKKQNAAMGIYALTARDVFRMIEEPQYRKKDLAVHCAFFEIYGSKVFDLLNERNSLRVLEDQQQKVQVVGLKEERALNEHDVLELITKGSLVRTAGTTSANANSSRSHAVFQIILRQGKKVWGKFSLIDLAGNERGQDTRECDRETRQEGAAINTSLLALKECIRGMARNSSHVPFRQSKLTMVLRDSFIGEKSRTVMISMISPGISSSEHTLNTLRYADRVKEMGTEGNGDATPIRDEDLFLPPVVQNSDDDEEETMDQKKAQQRVVAQCYEDLNEVYSRVVKDAKQVLSGEMSGMQRDDCISKIDQLSAYVSRLRSSLEDFQ